MQRDNYKWLDNAADTNVLTNLNERLRALQCEAMKRGLNYE